MPDLHVHQLCWSSASFLADSDPITKDTYCHTGQYVTGDIEQEYLLALETSVRTQDRQRAGQRAALVAT